MGKIIFALSLLLFAQPAYSYCADFWRCGESGCVPHEVCDDTEGTPKGLPPALQWPPPIIKIPPEPTTPFNQYEGDMVCRRAYLCNYYLVCKWEVLCR